MSRKRPTEGAGKKSLPTCYECQREDRNSKGFAIWEALTKPASVAVIQTVLQTARLLCMHPNIYTCVQPFTKNKHIPPLNSLLSSHNSSFLRPSIFCFNRNFQVLTLISAWHDRKAAAQTHHTVNSIKNSASKSPNLWSIQNICWIAKEESLGYSLYSPVKRSLGKTIQYLKHKEQSLGEDVCHCNSSLTGPENNRIPFSAANTGTANDFIFPPLFFRKT